MQKLQITVTTEEHKLLERRAKLLGFDVTKYAKFLLTREAFSEIGAEKCLSVQEIKDIDKALVDYKAGKAIKVDSLLELLKS